MAVTQNTYTGNGSTVLFSFTFPYLETTDIKVSLNGTVTTAYTLANATTIQFNTAPANGAAIRIYRATDDAALPATFYPGSAIRSADLNDNFTQNLYVTQESRNEAASATSTANTALTNSNTAISTANTASTTAASAVSTANTASANATAAVNTANTASTNATTAVNTANSASSTAASAVTTANNAVTTANTASSNASAAVTTANTAATNAASAVATANTASTNATAAVATANTASTNASNAVTTANTASSTASSAVTTANNAQTVANNAAAAVANALLYTVVANVAAIPGSPSNNAAIEVTDSTNIQSFTPLSGVPVGFTGNSGLGVRIVYSSASSSWTWVQYFANDPENRYLGLAGGTMTGALTLSGAPTTSNQAATKQYVDDNGASVTSSDVAPSSPADGDLWYNSSDGRTYVYYNDGDSSQWVDMSPQGGGGPFGQGSAASPSVSFIGDTNTGLYSPGADQLALSTNGTGRLFVDASGRVGVGTASPAVPLSVTTAASGEALRLTNGTNNERLHFYTGANALVEANNSNLALTAKDAYNIIFSTVNTERIRITSDGKVGLGTSSPSYKLHVDGETFFNKVVSSATGDYTRVNATAIFRGKSGRAVFIGTDNSSVSYVQVGNADIDSGTWPLAINPNGGNVGIGTQSPQTKLEVNNDSTTEIEVARFRSNGNTNNPMIRFVVDESQNVRKIDANGSVLGALAFNQGSNERMRIDSSGRLLVGTSSSRIVEDLLGNGPQGLIQIEAENSDAIMSIISAGTADAGRAGTLSLGRHRNSTVGGTPTVVQSGDTLGAICFAGGDGTDMRTKGASIACQVDGTTGANTMPGRLVFSTTSTTPGASPTERMRIDSSGRLLVGTTSTATSGDSASAKIQIQANTSATTGDALISLQRGQAAASISSDSPLGKILFADNAGNEYGVIQCRTDGSSGSGDYPGRLVFATTSDGAASPTERMRIKENGNLLINTTTEGAGIGFSTKLAIEGTDVAVFKNSAGSSANLIYAWNAATSGNNAFFGFGTEGTYTARGSINYNRSGGVVAYNTTSDYRAKTLIGEIENPGETIDALKVYRGVMNGATVERPMLVAHEAQEVAPYCVTGEKDAVDDDGNPIYQQMDHQVLVPLLIAEIQSLRQRVAALESA